MTINGHVRPMSKAAFIDASPWHMSIYGQPWWGCSYFGMKGDPWWEVETTDLKDRPRARSAFARWVRAFNRGEAKPVKLGPAQPHPDLVYVPSGKPGVSYAFSARNGVLLRDATGKANAAINPSFVVLLEKRLPAGKWWLMDDRKAFAYAIDGRACAIVMGYHNLPMPGGGRRRRTLAGSSRTEQTDG